MGTVYVVTAGGYDNNGVQGVFTTREKAEAYAAKISERYEPGIEEWELDDDELPNWLAKCQTDR